MMTENATVGTTDTDEPWRLCYEDEALLVVSKPTRMLSVPGKAEHKFDCLISRVWREFPEARIVHRLDWDTSGLMVLARHARAHSALSKAFQERQVNKRYIALVAGELAMASGEINLPLGPDPERKPRHRVDHEHGRPSLTLYQRLEVTDGMTRVALMPVTGRSHQLRIHLLALGHPIIGDSLYAPPQILAMSHRLMLHAEYLGFTHPLTGEWFQIEDPAPF